MILRGFDATLDGPRPHLVLEHLEGPRLSSLVRRYGPLPPEQLIPLGVQLASAVHYLSREGIVHMDIKPSNTIMGAPPRMIDMSVALSVEEARGCVLRSGRMPTWRLSRRTRRGSVPLGRPQTCGAWG